MMLERLKEMQEQGIFRLMTDNNLDTVVANLKSDDDVEAVYEPIQKYLRQLNHYLQYQYNVSLGKALSDFHDKFYYEMFDMAYSCSNHSNMIFQKEMAYGNAGRFSFGIGMSNAIFTLEERKLLKLINHYYISLMSKDGFNSDYFFIPMESLKLVFPKVCTTKLKEKIKETCWQLNSKLLYWDISGTKYTKNINDFMLETGNAEKLVGIDILYLPKKSKNGVVIEIKGIVCRISNFMKLRYKLGQISNHFSIDLLGLNYLDFVIAEKIDYRLHMDKKRHSSDINLGKLIEEVHLYTNNHERNETYLYQLLEEPNPQENIIRFIKAIITALSKLSIVRDINASFIIRDKSILELNKYIEIINLIKTSEDNKQMFNKLFKEQLKMIYDEIYRLGIVSSKSSVKYLLKTGNVHLVLRF